MLSSISRHHAPIKILVVGDGPVPHRFMNYRGDPLVKALLEAGHDVTLVVPAPDDPRDRLATTSRFHPHYVKRSGLGKTLGRLPTLIRIWLTLRTLTADEDFAVARTISLFPTITALLVTDLRNKTIANASDFYSDLYRQFRYPFARPVSRMIRQLERYVATHAALIIVDSSAQARLWAQLGAPLDHCVVIPHGVPQRQGDPKRFALARERIRQEIGANNGTLVLFYIGDISEMDGVDVLVSACALLRRQGMDCACLVIGSGPRPYLAKLRDLASRQGVDEFVHFVERVPHDSVAEYAYAADVCVAPFRKTPTSNSSIPNKILEYLASDRPIVATRGEALHEALGGAVFYADEGSAESLAHVVARLAVPGGSRGMFPPAAAVTKRLSWTELMREEVSVIEKVAESSGAAMGPPSR